MLQRKVSEYKENEQIRFVPGPKNLSDQMEQIIMSEVVNRIQKYNPDLDVKLVNVDIKIDIGHAVGMQTPQGMPDA